MTASSYGRPDRIAPPEKSETPSREWEHKARAPPRRAVARAGDVTAVFAANDDMAIGLIRALTEAGLRVPEEVSVVGFDDIPVSACVNPPLTTVRQLFDAVAREGLRLLVQAIEKPDVGPAPPATPRSNSSSAPPPLARGPSGPRTGAGTRPPVRVRGCTRPRARIRSPRDQGSAGVRLRRR
ncbi:substrate-binding domain-containing protein [Streptomyces sp. NPDC001848]|uniref:substrate-binding domain-containing protein n=1 Tax=Streptomyces sp. NPDC001848 TaxID=3364618 RepID=UPI0036BA7609